VSSQFANEGQTITIHDPNSGQKRDSPDFRKGELGDTFSAQKKVELPGFRDSMI